MQVWINDLQKEAISGEKDFDMVLFILYRIWEARNDVRMGKNQLVLDQAWRRPRGMGKLWRG